MAKIFSTKTTDIFSLVGEQMTLPNGDVMTVSEVRRDAQGWTASGLDDTDSPRQIVLSSPMSVPILA